MQPVEIETTSGSEQVFIRGYCADSLRPVLNTFVENFKSRNELGANLCISVEGETQLDLWGGLKRSGKQLLPWDEDTISVVFSCTKAATALCAHMLIDQGKMQLHAPVSDYWPEFAQNGKENVTVEMMLNHSVGVPAFREPIKPGGYLDWDYMADRLAKEVPFWSPGTRNGYHMITFGWTIGELVRRVSGDSLGQYFLSLIHI